VQKHCHQYRLQVQNKNADPEIFFTFIGVVVLRCGTLVANKTVPVQLVVTYCCE